MKVSVKQDMTNYNPIPGYEPTLARTLPVDYLTEQSSGWKITGYIMTDYYAWINDFEANHPVYGWVKGDYEDVIHAKSKKAYEHFVKNHPPEEWDYKDI
jgi:hypothetical protein